MTRQHLAAAVVVISLVLHLALQCQGYYQMKPHGMHAVITYPYTLRFVSVFLLPVGHMKINPTQTNSFCGPHHMV